MTIHHYHSLAYQLSGKRLISLQEKPCHRCPALTPACPFALLYVRRDVSFAMASACKQATEAFGAALALASDSETEAVLLFSGSYAQAPVYAYAPVGSAVCSVPLPEFTPRTEVPLQELLAGIELIAILDAARNAALAGASTETMRASAMSRWEGTYRPTLRLLLGEFIELYEAAYQDRERALQLEPGLPRFQGGG